MNTIGICEYVIGVIHGLDVWFYVGDRDASGNKLEPRQQYSSFLGDAKRYDDETVMADEVRGLMATTCLTFKLLEIQRCPKCGREFIERPALSREDNETEICPQCGVAEAVEAFENRVH